MTDTFQGLPPAAMKILPQLKDSNSLDWFSDQTSRHEARVRELPGRFVKAMMKPVHRHSECRTVISRNTGGILMRLCWSTQFAKDIGPDRTFVGICTRQIQAYDAHAPGIFLHIEPEQVFPGAGNWPPDSRTLMSIRQNLADRPTLWKQARAQRHLERHRPSRVSPLLPETAVLDYCQEYGNGLRCFS